MTHLSPTPGLWEIKVGDALEQLREIPDESVNCIVTSPPYWGLRDYGVAGQIGLEPTLDEFMARLADVFAECHRILKTDGTMWVNMGDSYASNWPCSRRNVVGTGSLDNGKRENRPPRSPYGLPDKSLIGQPWRLAFALQDAGWILRRDIIWHKPNPMPESTRDRPTTAHEYLFLLTKSGRYWYNADAIRTEATSDPSSWKTADGWDTGQGAHRSIHKAGREKGTVKAVVRKSDKQRGHSRRHAGFNDRWDAMSKEEQQATGANARSVWTIPTKGYRGAHFATFPPELPRRCILAGCPEGGLVLDPFTGSGTTLAVAVELGRRALGIELNPDYAQLAVDRLLSVTPSLFLAEPA